MDGSTADLVARLDAIREELGDAWRPGWSGIVDDEAATIIDELERRQTEQALDCLRDHGLLEESTIKLPSS